jgi:hypothetical protein
VAGRALLIGSLACAALLGGMPAGAAGAARARAAGADGDAAGRADARAADAGAAGRALSANWAGYVAVRSGAGGFSSVSGTWTQPGATCTAGREGFSAVWVGLGGYGAGSRALEQIGTDADCAASGRASYAAWFELVPAASVRIPLRVAPGERVSASVTVRGVHVTLRIRNLSTGARFSVTRRAAADTTSAEWIVEAPSLCRSSARCRTLALADFGRALFSSATATARRHTGTIEDSGWVATQVELRQGTPAGQPSPGGTGTPATVIVATPSATSAAAGSFSVSWHEQTLAAESPGVPTLPASAPGG